MNDRIGAAISWKLGGSIALEKKLLEILTRIDTHDMDAQYDDLENSVSMTIFGGKARLMRGFDEKIEALARVTTS